jgi:hypothetical protein
MADDSAEERIPAAPDRAFWQAGLLALLCGGLLAAATLIAYSGRGLFDDEGSFCTIAQGVLGGRLPYRDLFNEKPPLQYFWTAAVMAFGGPTLVSARIASSIMLALTAACIVLGPLRKRASGLAVAGLMLATAVIASRMEAYRNTADSSLALLYALSAILMVRGPLSTGNALTLGALQGFALGFRQTALAPILVNLFSPGLARRRTLFAVGLLAGLLAWLAPLAAAGILTDFVRATLLFHVRNAHVTRYVNHQISHGVSILVWLLLLGAVGASSARQRSARYWALGWLVAVALAYFGKQDAFRLWPSAAAALAMLAWDEKLRPAPSLVLRTPAIGLLAAAVLLGGVTALYGMPPRHPPVEAVAAALRRISRPQDEVWAGPFAPFVYCLSQRRPASRYYFVLPWTDKAEVRREISRDILAKSPVIVIDRSIRAFDIDKLLPELGPILKQGYQPSAPDDPDHPGRFTIYRPTQP